ncbi:MAG TPA: hypothetical protein VMX76_03060 [Nevskiaceae bacterium]|nr:hypothetical protein [Nevskiaceae bacterium]
MNITAIPLIKSITDLRYQAAGVFNVIKRKNQPVYITKDNKMIGVLLSPKIFAQLWEAYEDWRDQKIIDEIASSSSKKDFLDFFEFDKKQRKKSNLS